MIEILFRLHRGFAITSDPHMTYLGDGISTDEDFEEDTEPDVTPPVVPPSEDEESESDGPFGNPDEA